MDTAPVLKQVMTGSSLGDQIYGLIKKPRFGFGISIVAAIVCASGLALPHFRTAPTKISVVDGQTVYLASFVSHQADDAVALVAAVASVAFGIVGLAAMRIGRETPGGHSTTP